MIDRLLIEDVCRSVIQEYLGVSDEVTELSDEAFSLLSYAYDNTPTWMRHNFGGDHLYVKNMVFHLAENQAMSNLRLSEVISTFNVRLYGYDPRKTSYKDYIKYLTHLSKVCGEKLVRTTFVPYNSEVKIFFPFPFDGNIEGEMKRELMTALRHEFEHAWHTYKRGGMELTPQYMKSLRKTDWEKDGGTKIPLLRYNLKHCYYSLWPDEIDCKIHEIWYELENGSGRLEDCEGYKFMLDVQKDYKWVYDIFYPKNEFDAKYYENERSMFTQLLRDEVGLNAPSQWFKYCEKGIKKFNQQLKRVIGRHNAINGYQGNGSFKQYANGEIPQGEMFRKKKENPSLWKKLRKSF